MKVKILITFGISNSQSPAKQMTSFVALAVKEPTVRDCKQESVQPHSPLTKGRGRGGGILLNDHDVHFFFPSIRHVLIPLQNGFEMGDKAQGIGNHKEITALSNMQPLRLGAWSPFAFLDLNFVGVKDLRGWIEPPPDYRLLHFTFSWEAFSKTGLIFTMPLGKMVARHCSLPHTISRVPCPSSAGVTAPTSVEGGRGCCI